MNPDLYHYVIAPHITIRDAALVFAGIEPELCYIDLSNSFGPFDPYTENQKEAERRCKAKSFFNLLMSELSNRKSRLAVTCLVASLLKQKESQAEAWINITPDSMEGIPSELDVLIRNDDVLSLDNGKTLQFFMQNPSETLKENIFMGPWFISGDTSVTPVSIAEWADSKGVPSVFSKCLEPKPSRENGFSGAVAMDAPLLIDALLRPENPYISKVLKATLLALKHVMIHGTGKHNLTTAIEIYLEKNFPKLNNTLKGYVAKLLNIWGTKTALLPPLEEYLKSKAK
ncbi:hypothetical protein [Endozoicomonas sp. ONNA1]|uniref:hypothetical protein n=1 Tax=Endozoicomonas sp. ONNA1 TaxID=2828740 RepID=UPI0021488C5E|nr:hypothetical protein [Endozoicomonas sp. ONNA1]